MPATRHSQTWWYYDWLEAAEDEISRCAECAATDRQEGSVQNPKRSDEGSTAQEHRQAVGEEEVVDDKEEEEEEEEEWKQRSRRGSDLPLLLRNEEQEGTAAQRVIAASLGMP